MRRWLALLLLLFAVPALAQSEFNPFGEAGVDEHPGARIPIDAPLVDSHGHPTTLRALADGKPMVLVPVLHNCPNLCGVTLAGVADAISAQPLRPGRDFALTAFGIDPKEGPKDAAGDLQRMRQRPSMAGLGPVSALTGPEKSIRAITHALGYRYAWDDRIGQYAHIAAVAVLTPDGRLSSWLYGLSPTPGDLKAALAAAKQGQQASFGEKLLLLCFHYDPVTGRYTAVIDKVLKLAGILTVLTIVVLIWRLRKLHA